MPKKTDKQLIEKKIEYHKKKIDELSKSLDEVKKKKKDEFIFLFNEEPQCIIFEFEEQLIENNLNDLLRRN